ncbi:MAG TPA: 50S ribosomal protein L11 methyltransferase [Anaeromyxobacteraceae bacterium]|nr:50S ribosomal protein L11 methyltransferase [Anaeromyxobacteraceae bacterium]
MPAYVLTVEVEQARADDLAALLVDGGASGAEVRDATVLPMPGVARPAPGRARVACFFASRDAAEEAARSLGLSGQIDELGDQDWSEGWKRGLSPFVVGRVFIRPSFVAARPPAGAVEVVIDPGMAFGTGTHPTTALCLAALDACLAQAPGATVLDVGTGTGLLAIAARKLGSMRVVATDQDPVALRVAAENASRNGVELELDGRAPEHQGGPFHVVVANILANALVELAPGLASVLAPGGTLLLSGILSGQEGEVLSAYLAAGLRRDEDRERSSGEWRLLALAAPGPGLAGSR